MRKAILMEVHGHVQGVGFRYFVYRVAIRHRMSGWVRNTARGTVEGLLHGETEELSVVRKELERGPRLSRVDRVDWQALSTDDPRIADEEVATGGFEVRH